MIDIYVPSYKRPNAPVIRKLISAGIPFTIVLDHDKIGRRRVVVLDDRSD